MEKGGKEGGLEVRAASTASWIGKTDSSFGGRQAYDKGKRLSQKKRDALKKKRVSGRRGRTAFPLTLS